MLQVDVAPLIKISRLAAVSEKLRPVEGVLIRGCVLHGLVITKVTHINRKGVANIYQN
jgi:hypothetical protein